MVSLRERPYEVAFSRNPVVYKLNTDTSLSTPGLKIDVRLMFRKYGTSDFIQIFSLSLVPDSAGFADIDVSKVLDSLVDYQLPSVTGASGGRAWDQAGQFYIDYREITTAAPSPAWISDLSNNCIVIKGGLPHQSWQGPNYFINYNGNLTWQKTGRYIGPSEKSWFTYLHLGTNNQADMALKVNIYYTDGSSALNAVTVPLPDAAVPKYGVYRIPVGSQLALKDFDPAKVINYYTARIVHGTTNVTVEFKYIVDYRNNYSKTTLFFFNSLGGFDGVRLLGELARKSNYDRQFSEKTLGGKYYSATEVVAMQENTKNLEQVQYSGSVGMMDDEDQFDRLRELMISTKVQEIKFNRWSPVLITSTAVDLGNNSDPIKDFPVEYTPGFVNESYAPDIKVGDLPACPIITGFALTGFSSIGWDANAAHVQYVIERWDILQTAVQEVIYTSSNTYSFDESLIGYARVKALCGFSETPFTSFIYFG